MAILKLSLIPWPAFKPSLASIQAYLANIWLQKWSLGRPRSCGGRSAGRPGSCGGARGGEKPSKSPLRPPPRRAYATHESLMINSAPSPAKIENKISNIKETAKIHPMSFLYCVHTGGALHMDQPAAAAGLVPVRVVRHRAH